MKVLATIGLAALFFLGGTPPSSSHSHRRNRVGAKWISFDMQKYTELVQLPKEKRLLNWGEILYAFEVVKEHQHKRSKNPNYKFNEAHQGNLVAATKILNEGVRTAQERGLLGEDGAYHISKRKK